MDMLDQGLNADPVAVEEAYAKLTSLRATLPTVMDAGGWDAFLS
eukprot:COSAG02_NODE_11573_length_1696_cov_10.407799_3_plen_43_part_01